MPIWLRRAALLMAVFSSWASAEPPAAFQKQCLGDGQAQAKFEEIKASSGFNSQQIPITSASELDECWKRTYVRNHYKFVVFRDPQSEAPGEISGLVTTTQSDLNPAVCLQKSLALLQALQEPSTEAVLKRYQARFSWMWDDPDIGPATWIHCQTAWLAGEAPPAYAYFASLRALLNQFLNQLVEKVDAKGCFYDPSADRSICWDERKELPSPRLATLESIPTQEDSIRAAIEGYEALLAKEEGYPLFSLFERMNLEITDLRLRAALLRDHGAAGVLENPSDRPFEALPLIARLTVRYLDRLRSRQPRLYEETIGASTANRTQVVRLFQTAQAAYEDWLKILSEKTGRTAADAEVPLWHDFLADRKKLGLETKTTR